MTIHTYLPSTALQPFIRQYLIVESEEAISNKLLPGTALTIAFRFRGQVDSIVDHATDTLPACSVSGIRQSVRYVNYHPHSAVIIVQCKEAGAAAFFKQPLHNMFNASLPLDVFVAQDKIRKIEEQLHEALHHEQRISIIDKFFLSIMKQHKPDALLTRALHHIHFTNGFIKVKDLASNLYISQDAFEKRFRKAVGTSPKQFSSLVRNKWVVKKINSSQTLTDLAFEAGYSDASHFSKDFKMFTGQTPSEFIKSFQPFW